MPLHPFLLRLGRFDISESLIYSDPVAVAKLMEGLLVLEVEHHFDTKTYTYMAASELFEPCFEGDEAPRYEVTEGGFRRV